MPHQLLINKWGKSPKLLNVRVQLQSFIWTLLPQADPHVGCYLPGNYCILSKYHKCILSSLTWIMSPIN